MIEPSAILLGDCSIAPTAYVGHYSILGTPQPSGRFGVALAEAGPWHQSVGVTVGDRSVIGHHTIIDDGTEIGPEVWIGSGVRIGHNSRVGRRSEIYYEAQIYDRVVIGSGAWIGGFLCNDTVIGDGAIVLGTTAHRFVDATIGTPEDAPVVKRGAFIGMGAFVIGGVTVGEGAYIATGCVLTHDAEPDTLYLGNPGRAAGPAPRPLAPSPAREPK